MTMRLLFLLVLCGGAWAQSKPSEPPASSKVTVDGKPVPSAPVVPPPVVSPSKDTKAGTVPLPEPSVAPSLSEETSYPLPLADRDKFRDLQHEYDQLEIDSGKMQVKIEQNKARQSALMDAMKVIAFQFSQAKKIDLDLYELDPGQVRFTKRKPVKP